MLRIKLCVLTLVTLSSPAVSVDGEAVPFSHNLLHQTLQAHVDTKGLVDYEGLQHDPAALDAYVDSLALVSPTSAAQRFRRRADQLAYWINAYNALVLHSVVSAYPIASVADLGGLDGFFDKRLHILGGDSVSLNHIENKIIRPQFRDPRIHFAVNCGAASCPALDRRAYDGGDLEEHLERQTHRFASDPAHLSWQDGALYMSRLLEWYRQDFADTDTSDAALIGFLQPYTPPKLAASIHEHVTPIRFLDYDWKLNVQPRRKGAAE
ncbi:MAG: DUF547 domain-containing protein [Gemmatimonadetes bacterium]|jgi:hypothetical protein|nr:DUF547 domain-containing protein [Gemmatimonadota bacterium]MBT5964132.1 DUF547 domain-containing protein [Gemmatimonadota bacterium]MBT6625576.1 DUF547 domain-containing protein [Gemmatimonadota bacterium]MBT7457364.1 DUF547 domain-containing protein [Gemmatimonadota bacterium]